MAGEPRGAAAVVLAGLVTLTIAAPLLVGGAPPGAQVALGTAGLFVGAAALFERSHRLRLRPLLLAFAMAALFTALQLVRVPAAKLVLLSPEAAALRGVFADASWMPITLDVPATTLALLRDLLGLVVFTVAATIGRSNRRSRAVVGAIVLAAVIVAVAALIERATGTRKIFGVYTFTNWPGSGIWGSFVNGNHAASLFTLGALVAAGAAVELRDLRRILAAGVAIALGAMTLYTRSRGGAIGLLAGGLLFAVWLMARRFGRWRGAALAVLVVTVIAVPAGLVAQGLRDRLTNPATLVDNQKTRGWRAGLRAASAFAWTGVGRGAFEAPVAAYRRDDEGVRLVYPENAIVQRAAELGWPATLILLGLFAFGVWRLRGGLQHLSPLFVGATSAIVAVMIHELFDFGTELPGVAVPLASAIGVVAGRLVDHGKSTGPPIPRWVPMGVLLGLAATIVASKRALPELADKDFATTSRAMRASPATTAAEVDAARRRHPADGYFELLAAERILRARQGNPLPSLNRAMKQLPTEPQAHWLAARVLVGEKRIAQGALEYRLAIERRLAPPWDEMLRSLGAHIVEAMPQTPAMSELLIRKVIERHRTELVKPAIERYLTLTEGSEASYVLAAQLAHLARQPALVAALLDELLDQRPREPESYVQAVHLATEIGDGKLAERAYGAGVKLHPQSARLVLTSVRALLRVGSLVEARLRLRSFPAATATLAERRERELLMAEIAAKDGALDEAAAARARAAAIERELRGR